MMENIYEGREQTKAKHFILRNYLQALAFKVLSGQKSWKALNFVDGFCGPWKTRAPDFSDSSFKIALDVLKDAQRAIRESTGTIKTIRCFFSENNAQSYEKLQCAVAEYHDPNGKFIIDTFEGDFEDGLCRIKPFLEDAFSLFFIDPTGWTGFSLDALNPYLRGRGAEVLVNFMYDHINRFKDSNDSKIISSFDPILGGKGWQERLDPDLPRGLAVEKLFRDELAKAGGFDHVLSTCIDKSTSNRPHFFLVYGTKSYQGMKVFRDVEAKALKENDRDRAQAKQRKRAEGLNMDDLFGDKVDSKRSTYDELLGFNREKAETRIIEMVSSENEEFTFQEVSIRLMQAFMLRETHIKDICADLAKNRFILKSWKGQKPKGDDVIRLINT